MTRYSDPFTDVRGTPRNVAVSPDEIVVLGTPPQDDDEETGHNCDAMGCGSVGDHVLFRAAIATPPRPAAVAEGDVRPIALADVPPGLRWLVEQTQERYRLLGEARDTNRRLNRRVQQLESQIATPTPAGDGQEARDA